jgi:Lantibiotic dehydratase, N terminus
VFATDPDGEHRVQIGAGWSLWKAALLRGAGFPGRRVLALATDLGALTDRLLVAQDAEARARDAARAALHAILTTLPGKARDPLTKAMKKLARGELPAMTTELIPVSASIEAVTQLAQATASARAAVDAALVRAEAHELDVLEATAHDLRFREALTWQNRGAIRTGLDLLRPDRGPVTSKQRGHHRLVASYLQRYCVKNDRAGFFGPAVWARIEPSVRAIEWHLGDDLLAHRRVYFEYWGQEALARTIAASEDLHPYLTPRIMPTVSLDGTTLRFPVDCITELPHEFAAVLAACDGERTAQGVAEVIVADATLGFEDADEVYHVLEELRARELVTWTIELPTALGDPERALRAILARAGAAGVPGLALLDQLEARKADVAGAAGDPVALDRALAALETSFESMTGQLATRAAGQMYAGRMLVFEQCRRDFDLALGSEYLTKLSPALLLLLRSARWYTQVVARAYRVVLEQAYRELVEETGSSTIDYLRFWQRIAVHFPNAKEPAPIIQEARAALQQHWTRILGFPGTADQIEVQVADIEAAVADAFGDAVGHAWPSARYQSIDIMIAGAGPEAVRRGDYSLCIGELHCGIDNTANPADRDLHPDPASLIRAREVDLPDPSITLVRALGQAKFGGQLTLSRQDFDLELGSARSWRPRSQVIAVGATVVESVGDKLVVRCRKTDRSFDLLAFLQDDLLAEEEVAGGLNILPAFDRMPRVVIGGVTVSRRQWRMDPATLTFAREPRGVAQFAGARRWARDHGLPRWVFVKTPEEVKPVFVDFDSLVYVEQLAKLARAASRIAISEMQPDLHQLWLPDAASELYTSELRMLALAPDH